MNSRVVVKKFGGTSVGSIDRIRSVARLCARFRSLYPDQRLVVVASAMSGETNRLLALARSCVAAPHPRELDALVATGELQSCALLAMALIELGVPAVSVSAAQAGLKTDGLHLEARIEGVESHRLEEWIAQDIVPVVAGFQGITEEGDVTTLGRGGSDITAVALAAALKASRCMIYSDVPGIFTADPRVVKQAKMLATITHEEMLELAALGAKVLHPRCVEFAYRYRIPLVSLSSFESGDFIFDSGTHVVRAEEISMEQPAVSGVTARSDEAKLTIFGLPNHTIGMARLFEALAQAGISVDQITFSGQELDSSGQSRAHFSCLVPDLLSEQSLRIAQDLIHELGHLGAGLERDIARVSVVGVGMRSGLGIASQVLAVLAEQKVSVDAFTTSDIRISCVVPKKYAELAVRALHRALIEKRDGSAMSSPTISGSLEIESSSRTPASSDDGQGSIPTSAAASSASRGFSSSP